MRFISPDEKGEEFVTAAEAAAICGVTRNAISQWAHRGYLNHVAVLMGTCAHLYARADVIACNEARTRGAGARGAMPTFSGTECDFAECHGCDVWFAGRDAVTKPLSIK